MSKSEDEHIAWWRGFKVAKEAFHEVLDTHEFDFSGCTNSDQVCKLIKKAIEIRLKDIWECKCGAHENEV